MTFENTVNLNHIYILHNGQKENHSKVITC